MALPSGLTAIEIAAFLDARINTIENILCSLTPGFNTDLEGVGSVEIDASPLIDADSKVKLKAYLRNIRDRHKINR